MIFPGKAQEGARASARLYRYRYISDYYYYYYDYDYHYHYHYHYYCMNFVSNKRDLNHAEMCRISENWSKCKFRNPESRIVTQILCTHIKSKKN